MDRMWQTESKAHEVGEPHEYSLGHRNGKDHDVFWGQWVDESGDFKEIKLKWWNWDP